MLNVELRYLDGEIEGWEREVNETIAVLNSTPGINAPGVRSRRPDRNVDMSSLSDTGSVYSDRSNDRNARRGSVGRVQTPNIQFTSNPRNVGDQGTSKPIGIKIISNQQPTMGLVYGTIICLILNQSVQ